VAELDAGHIPTAVGAVRCVSVITTESEMCMPDNTAACSLEHPEECPRVLDTYAVVYSFILLFLVPGAILVGRLPFRTYTFAYVSLVTVPFVLGIVLTLLTDSHDDARTVLKRIAVLTPLIVVSGVAVMFLSVIALVPINMFLGPAYRDLMTPVAGAVLVAVAAPLVAGIFRRLRGPWTGRRLLQLVSMVLALIAAGAVVYLSVFQVGELGVIAKEARKDVVIYIVGALVWYLPSFGIAAGVWRRLGLI